MFFRFILLNNHVVYLYCFYLAFCIFEKSVVDALTLNFEWVCFPASCTTIHEHKDAPSSRVHSSVDRHI